MVRNLEHLIEKMNKNNSIIHNLDSESYTYSNTLIGLQLLKKARELIKEEEVLDVLKDYYSIREEDAFGLYNTYFKDFMRDSNGLEVIDSIIIQYNNELLEYLEDCHNGKVSDNEIFVISVIREYSNNDELFGKEFNKFIEEAYDYAGECRESIYENFKVKFYNKNSKIEEEFIEELINLTLSTGMNISYPNIFPSLSGFKLNKESSYYCIFEKIENEEEEFIKKPFAYLSHDFNEAELILDNKTRAVITPHELFEELRRKIK